MGEVPGSRRTTSVALFLEHVRVYPGPPLDLKSTPVGGSRRQSPWTATGSPSHKEGTSPPPWSGPLSGGSPVYSVV